MTLRIAMWSGPRNISTAMMRAWENRPDTVVVDEPFYACYLVQNRIVHPMQDEIIASQPSDWQAVIDERLSNPLPEGVGIQYQKQMTHHMTADPDPEWFSNVRHAFLVRDPVEVVLSYREKMPTLTQQALGFERQFQLYERACDSGQKPPVLDAKDVLNDPKGLLTALCAALGIAFDNAMLQWPAGRRDSDGAWAPHWYGSVWKSTGFMPWQPKSDQPNDEQKKVIDECMPYYEQLHRARLMP